MTMEMMMLEMTMVMMTMLEMMMMTILEMMIITGWVRQTLVESTRPLPRYVTLWCHHKYLCFGKQLAFKEPSAKTETLCKLSCVQIFTLLFNFISYWKPQSNNNLEQESGWVGFCWHIIACNSFTLVLKTSVQPKLWRKMNQKIKQNIFNGNIWKRFPPQGVADKCPRVWRNMNKKNEKKYLKLQSFPPQGVGDSFPSTRGRLQVANLTKCSSYY